MNKILENIEEIIYRNRTTYLPDVKEEHLEENGAVYYMNGKNGTEFDWHVNQKISDFMVFYNDEKNLGAVKLTLYVDGTAWVYIYGDSGENLIQEICEEIEVAESEILKLAVTLKKEADDKLKWDLDIQKLNSDVEVLDEEVKKFCDNITFYEESIVRKRLMNKTAYVSRKMLDEGWKVGYMVHDEPLHEKDSGWSFMVGNEDDDYLEDAKNIVLLEIGQVCMWDSDVFAHIESPVGSAFVRVAADKLEADTGRNKIFLQKKGDYA